MTEWIPIASNCRPKEEQKVLVQVFSEILIAKYHKADYAGPEIWHLLPDNRMEVDLDTIDAWMPLPEPYELKEQKSVEISLCDVKDWREMMIFDDKL